MVFVASPRPHFIFYVNAPKEWREWRSTSWTGCRRERPPTCWRQKREVDPRVSDVHRAACRSRDTVARGISR